MADADFTQKDQSRFQLRSYGWRDIDINSDVAIKLLEQAFQSSCSIGGIASMLRQGFRNGDGGGDAFNAAQVDQLLTAVEQLSESLSDGICNYAERIEEKVKARKAALSKGGK